MNITYDDFITTFRAAGIETVFHSPLQGKDPTRKLKKQSRNIEEYATLTMLMDSIPLNFSHLVTVQCKKLRINSSGAMKNKVFCFAN